MKMTPWTTVAPTGPRATHPAPSSAAEALFCGHTMYLDSSTSHIPGGKDLGMTMGGKIKTSAEVAACTGPAAN